MRSLLHHLPGSLGAASGRLCTADGRVVREIRLTGPGREQFRLFCLLENGSEQDLATRGLQRCAISVITGMRKPWRTVFSERDYERVRTLGEEHKRNYPCRIAM